MRKINLIVVHCTATRCDRRFSVEDLIAWHDARFGFTGYHYYITRDGQMYQTRHENLVGAHAVGYNQHSIGVCYEGGLMPEGTPADTRTQEQKAALHALLKSLKVDYPDAVILGHRDLPNVHKDCPCFDAAKEYKNLIKKTVGC
jgi:N-acetyl-anhydromuramyl-L-alanine amidase AmpD